MSKGLSPYNDAVKLNSGRVGNIRYYNKDGKTYTRSTTVSTKTNPRSERQMRVRTRLPNITRIYQALHDVCAGGFESRTKSRSDFNVFCQYASQCPNVYLTRQMANTNQSVAAEYPLSQGSLMTVSYIVVGDALVTNIKIGNLDMRTATVGQLAEAVIEGNKSRIVENDYINFVAICQEGIGEQVKYVDVNAWSVQLNTEDTRPVSEVCPYLANTDNFLGIADLSEIADEGTFGFVHARIDEKKGYEKYSTQCTVAYSVNADSVYDYYTSQEAFEAAAASYGDLAKRPFYLSGGISDDPVPPTDLNTITVNVADYCTAMGKVQINDGPMDNTEKTLEVEPGTQVTIKAEPVAGYQFCNWSDGDSNATRTVTVNDDCEFTAEFEES